MWNDSKSAAALHPSIDGLVALIQGTKTGTSEDAEKLRDVCRRKLRSYREDDFLKRFVDAQEQNAARIRWGIVSAFANQRPKGAATTGSA